MHTVTFLYKILIPNHFYLNNFLVQSVISPVLSLKVNLLSLLNTITIFQIYQSFKPTTSTPEGDRDVRLLTFLY